MSQRKLNPIFCIEYKKSNSSFSSKLCFYIKQIYYTFLFHFRCLSPRSAYFYEFPPNGKLLFVFLSENIFHQYYLWFYIYIIYRNCTLMCTFGSWRQIMKCPFNKANVMWKLANVAKQYFITIIVAHVVIMNSKQYALIETR